ncbi:free fatty acid receptor 2-like [Esox lucius]|uniref:G-protein coupled receptors family 1 profile domain-containing protein n=1 Tax=Esox lucius TaxID=8010 RepID=A0A3P8Z2A5_ESOLU|nr:free fatty acid receptor 2-like [Esox lucius]
MAEKDNFKSYGHSTLWMSIYIITFVTGFPANAVALYTFVKKVRQKAIPIDILLLNLSISDLIFLLFLPVKIKEVMDNMIWQMPEFLCFLTSFVFYTTIYNSILLLTAISVERYLGVAFPIKYKLKSRPLHAVIASFFFWVISIGHISVVYIMESSHPFNTTNTEYMCYSDFTEDQLNILILFRLELFLVLFCVPFFICSFCYIKFVCILSQLPNISKRKRLRAIGLSLATLLVFIVCFTPYNLSHIVGFVNWNNTPWRVDALISSVLNASLDPIIFYFSSLALRSTYHHFLKTLLERVQGLWCRCKTLSWPMLVCPRNQNKITPSSNDNSL